MFVPRPGMAVKRYQPMAGSAGGSIPPRPVPAAPKEAGTGLRGVVPGGIKALNPSRPRYKGVSQAAGKVPGARV